MKRFIELFLITLMGISALSLLATTTSATDSKQMAKTDSLLISAKAGDALAQVNLAYAYSEAEGIVKNDSLSTYWYTKAADNGRADAQAMLAYRFSKGLGTTQDDVVANQWYKKAADNGNVEAMYNLGCRYSNGTGVDKDASVAVKWYLLAADKRKAKAMYNLGVCYQNGTGVDQSYPEAYFWYMLATTFRGPADSGGRRDQMATEISKDDYEYQNKRAQEWVNSHQK